MPHLHHEDDPENVCTLEKENLKSVKDWLQFVLHKDMGEGHLEHFLSGQGQYIDQKAPSNPNHDFHYIITDLSYPFIAVAKSYPNFLEEDYAQSAIVHGGQSLRGPPRFS